MGRHRQECLDSVRILCQNVVLHLLLIRVTPEEAREGMFKKMDSFKNAHGTILFYEDRKSIR